jgi:hypothetical protein
MSDAPPLAAFLLLLFLSFPLLVLLPHLGKVGILFGGDFGEQMLVLCLVKDTRWEKLKQSAH